MNTLDYNYYIYRTSEDYKKKLNDGLPMRDFEILNTITQVDDKEVEQYLESYMKGPVDDGTCDSVILVKIPKCYFGYYKHRNGDIDYPIPFLYEKNSDLEDGYYPFIVPNLIQGCYNKEDGFITNDKFCPVFDPSGLKFSIEQMKAVLENKNSIDGSNFFNEYEKRNKNSCRNLFTLDKKLNSWDSIVSYFSKRFNVKPAIPFNNVRDFDARIGKKIR